MWNREHNFLDFCAFFGCGIRCQHCIGSQNMVSSSTAASFPSSSLRIHWPHRIFKEFANQKLWKQKPCAACKCKWRNQAPCHFNTAQGGGSEWYPEIFWSFLVKALAWVEKQMKCRKGYANMPACSVIRVRRTQPRSSWEEMNCVKAGVCHGKRETETSLLQTTW